MRFDVILTPQALTDIQRNAGWWYINYSKTEALKWAQSVEQQLQTLQDFPRKASLAPENAQFSFELRQLHVGTQKRKTYRALFRVEKHRVRVLAIRRCSEKPILRSELPGATTS